MIVKEYRARRIFEMKLFKPPKCLDDAIIPLRTLNCLMGLRAFEYPHGQIRSLLSLTYLLLILSTYCASLYIQQEHYSHMKLLKLEYVLYKLLLYLNTFIVMYEMFLGWYYTKRLDICYRKISEIDKTLQQLGSTIDYSKMYVVTIMTIVVWFTFICVTSSMDLILMLMKTDIYSTVCLTLSYAYGISISSVIIFEFSTYVKCLQTRFKLINQLLSTTIPSVKETKSDIFDIHAKTTNFEQRKYISSMKVLPQLNRHLQPRLQIFVPEKQNTVKSQMRSHLPFEIQQQFQIELQSQSRNQVDSVITEYQKYKHLLQIIKQAHLELCKVSKTLCTCFGVQISSEIGLSVMLITGILYNIYVKLAHRQDTFHNTIQKLSMMIVMTVPYILKIVFLNHVCKNAANEGNKTSQIISTAYGLNVDIDTREEIQQFGLQISQSPVTFTAFGFTLDYRVLTSCLRTVTTYLVIMVQVSNSLESRNENIQGTRSN